MVEVLLSNTGFDLLVLAHLFQDVIPLLTEPSLSSQAGSSPVPFYAFQNLLSRLLIDLGVDQLHPAQYSRSFEQEKMLYKSNYRDFQGQRQQSVDNGLKREEDNMLWHLPLPFLSSSPDSICTNIQAKGACD
jgi:hypothetical protein